MSSVNPASCPAPRFGAKIIPGIAKWEEKSDREKQAEQALLEAAKPFLEDVGDDSLQIRFELDTRASEAQGEPVVQQANFYRESPDSPGLYDFMGYLVAKMKPHGTSSSPGLSFAPSPPGSDAGPETLRDFLIRVKICALELYDNATRIEQGKNPARVSQSWRDTSLGRDLSKIMPHADNLPDSLLNDDPDADSTEPSPTTVLLPIFADFINSLPDQEKP